MHALLDLDYQAPDAMERLVTALVQATLEDAGESAASLIQRLRRLEVSARAARSEAQTIQVIASGRRLLGDREDLASPTRRH